MKDRNAIRANERYRTISRTLFQLGTALIAAAVVKGYNVQTVTVELVGWFFASGALMWVGWKVLGLLDTEDA